MLKQGMAKVTSKLQFTLPKKLAEQVGISPGDEVDVSLAGEGLRIVPIGRITPSGVEHGGAPAAVPRCVNPADRA